MGNSTLDDSDVVEVRQCKSCFQNFEITAQDGLLRSKSLVASRTVHQVP